MPLQGWHNVDNKTSRTSQISNFIVRLRYKQTPFRIAPHAQRMMVRDEREGGAVVKRPTQCGVRPAGPCLVSTLVICSSGLATVTEVTQCPSPTVRVRTHLPTGADWTSKRVRLRRRAVDVSFSLAHHRTASPDFLCHLFQSSSHLWLFVARAYRSSQIRQLVVICVPRRGSTKLAGKYFTSRARPSSC